MQLKSGRGVQQADVWTAADGLIAEGLRPTIERVRQKLGRGSPNTVSPMLEAWFATLGPRLALNQVGPEKGGMPESVQQAMAKLWDAALATAQEQAAQFLDLAHQALGKERSALAIRESELELQAKLQDERRTALEAATAEAQSQVAKLNSRLQEAHAQLARRAIEIEQAQSNLNALGSQLTEERKLRDLEVKRHAEERQRLESRAIANDRRLLQQLDQERQSVKLAQTATKEAEQRAGVHRATLESTNNLLVEKLQQLEFELVKTQQALTSERAHSATIREMLDEQRKTTNATITQLNQLLTAAASPQATQLGTVAVKRNRSSRKKNTTNP